MMPSYFSSEPLPSWQGMTMWSITESVRPLLLIAMPLLLVMPLATSRMKNVRPGRFHLEPETHWVVEEYRLPVWSVLSGPLDK